jgi:hypothetical protein
MFDEEERASIYTWTIKLLEIKLVKLFTVNMSQQQ